MGLKSFGEVESFVWGLKLFGNGEETREIGTLKLSVSEGVI